MLPMAFLIIATAFMSIVGVSMLFLVFYISDISDQLAQIKTIQGK